MTPERKKKITLWIIGVATACIVIFLGIQNLSTVADAVAWCFSLVSSLAIGLGFALVLNVPMSFFESKLFRKTKKRILVALRRPIAYVTSLLLILAALAGIVWLVIPELVEAVTTLVETAINYINKINSMSTEEIAELPFGNVLLNTNWNEILSNLKDWLKNQGSNIVGTAFGTISTLVSGIFDLVISFVFSVYILFSKEKLKNGISRVIRVWMPERIGAYTIHVFSVLGRNLRSFVFGQSLEAVIIGVLCTIGMLILRLPYAAPVGALIGVTALIPILGSYIGAAVGAFLIVTVSPMKAVVFLIFLIILQQLEGNLIYPRVMGSKVKLPGMWILAAVTIGGGIAGPLGMLLSVPIASTLYVLIGEATDAKAARLGIDAVAEKANEPECPTEAEEQEISENNDESSEPR